MQGVLQQTEEDGRNIDESRTPWSSKVQNDVRLFFPLCSFELFFSV